MVEDNPTDVFVIRQILLGCGLNLRVEVARNGQEALVYLEGLSGSRPAMATALVLLDLNVPKVTGIELLQFIRTKSCLRQMPVIVVTSSNAESDRTAAERLGADGYFPKPADLNAYQRLAALVRDVIGRTGQASLS